MKDKPLQAKQVIRVYHYLYRFSLQRLHRLVHNPSMVKLFSFYYSTQGLKRIEQSRTMRKYKEAYIEAAENLQNIGTSRKRQTND